MNDKTLRSTEPPPARGAGFSIHDTNVLKGVGILGIAFHNYFHRVPGIVQENEFAFDPARFGLFIEQVMNPATTVQALFSFLGHYGVGIFITLSCYGLACTSTRGRPQTGIAFLKSRVLKLMPTIALCIAIWLLLQVRTHGLSDGAYWSAVLLEVLLLCMGVQTLVPGLELPAVGPWWFIPFILQFYLLWSLAGARLMRTTTPVLLAWAAAALALVPWLGEPLLRNYQINLLETPLGHVPDIVLGILLTRFRPARFGPWLLPMGLLLLLSNLFELLWPLGTVAATLAVLIGFDRFRGPFSRGRLLAWIGSLSLPIFMLNGFVRRPFLTLASASDLPGADIVYALASVLCSIVLAALLAYLVNAFGPTRPGALA